MEVMDAIYKRRAVRAYAVKKVDKATVTALIKAAIQAPSALNAQPWAFAVIQDEALLKRCSDRAKAHLLGSLGPGSPLSLHRDMLENPDFNIFYDAATLVIICAKPAALNAAEDCCLAAQNLMLSAYAMGLGTCPIGFARPWLNLPEVKRELGISADHMPVFPVIVGFPKGDALPVPRKEPEILFWK
jgi:nitroreductase